MTGDEAMAIATALTTMSLTLGRQMMEVARVHCHGDASTLHFAAAVLALGRTISEGLVKEVARTTASDEATLLRESQELAGMVETYAKKHMRFWSKAVDVH